MDFQDIPVLQDLPLLSDVFLGNTLLQWISAAAIALVVLASAGLIRAFIARRSGRLAEATGRAAYAFVAAAARATRWSVLLATGLYVGSRLLAIDRAIDLWVQTAYIMIVLIQAGIWGNALIGVWLARYEQHNLGEHAARVTTVRALSLVLRLVLFSIVLLLVLDNIPGVEITALIASLGIGGIAVALALQNILADLFASLSIAFDKPFVIGDFIIVGDMMGTVEEIGLKTTRVRSLSGEQLIFSNSDLLNSRIRNYKRMQERRVVFTIGVPYATPAEQLRAIPQLLRESVEEQEGVRFDRAHFSTYGDFALVFEVVYYVLSADYNTYMDIQQAINMAIFERFTAREIGFAYPTQTIHLAGVELRSQNGRARLEREA